MIIIHIKKPSRMDTTPRRAHRKKRDRTTGTVPHHEHDDDSSTDSSTSGIPPLIPIREDPRCTRSGTRTIEKKTAQS
jgi:hypothetical protein